jgi:hypothetical protein
MPIPLAKTELMLRLGSIDLFRPVAHFCVGTSGGAPVVGRGLEPSGGSSWFPYGSRPKTATLFVVATKTFASATTGAMYLLPAPKWSRPLDA